MNIRQTHSTMPRCGLVLAVLVICLGVPAFAQEAQQPPAPPSLAASGSTLPQAVVGIIDYQKILRDSKAASSIRGQVEARRTAYQDEITKREQSLRDEDQSLAKQRTVLSAEAFATKRKSFEKELADVQKEVQGKRRMLDEVTAKALNEVREAIIQVVSELADVKGFNLVVPSSTVLVFSPRIDITQDVLTALDQRLPDVKVAEATPAALPQ